jgi:hypothetical protein
MSFFGGKNTSLTAHWEPEPNKRGTFSILSTCLFTMLLCVWTAVHLNIPEDRSKKQFWRKTLWLFFGLVAPELVCLACPS